MKKIFLILIILLVITTTFIISCNNDEINGNIEPNTELIYNREKNTSSKLSYEPHISIKLIERISKENVDFKNAFSKSNLNLSLKGEILKYTYDSDIISYKIGNVFIYSYQDKILPIKSIETNDSNKDKVIIISNIDNSKYYYKLTIETNDNNSKIKSFEILNPLPFESLGFNKKITKLANKNQEYCSDYSWSDCMDCTVSECASKWWCVGLLTVAGPETLAGMAASCL